MAVQVRERVHAVAAATGAHRATEEQRGLVAANASGRDRRELLRRPRPRPAEQPECGGGVRGATAEPPGGRDLLLQPDVETVYSLAGQRGELRRRMPGEVRLVAGRARGKRPAGRDARCPAERERDRVGQLERLQDGVDLVVSVRAPSRDLEHEVHLRRGGGGGGQRLRHRPVSARRRRGAPTTRRWSGSPPGARDRRPRPATLRPLSPAGATLPGRARCGSACAGCGTSSRRARKTPRSRSRGTSGWGRTASSTTEECTAGGGSNASGGTSKRTVASA